MTNNQIRIGEDSTLIQITSEPYVIYTKRGYQPVINISKVHTGEDGYLIISAQSLSDPLHQLAERNCGRLSKLVLLIKKASRDRMSPYIVSEQS